MTHEQTARDDEFVTIIGSDMAQITQAFRAQGLSAREFSIVHRAGRHRFTVAGAEGSSEMFEGQPLMAATYRRHTNS